MLYWYKHGLGQKPVLVSTKYKFDEKVLFYNEFKDNPRVQLSPENELSISDLKLSDSGSYYCANTQHYELNFSEPTSIVVKTGKGLDILTEVHESPSRKSVILKCSVHVGSCEGRPRVHWFKQSGGSSPGVLYSEGGGDSDQCERKTDALRTCVYNLPVQSVSSEQTETYYCAVATCGYLLFRKATTLNGQQRFHCFE